MNTFFFQELNIFQTSKLPKDIETLKNLKSAIMKLNYYLENTFQPCK